MPELIFLANIVLDECVERIYVKDMYGEIPLGVYIIRGENVVLLGELVLVTTDRHESCNPFYPRIWTATRGNRCGKYLQTRFVLYTGRSRSRERSKRSRSES